jgi:hypothetical protein
MGGIVLKAPGHGEEKRRRRGFQREDALGQFSEGGKLSRGKLSRGELLRCGVRYFSKGMVLGSRAFVEEAFKIKRDWFGVKRKTGAHGLATSEGT